MAHPKVDAELIAELTAQLEKNSLTELEWTEGDRTIRVVRNPGGAPAPPQEAPVVRAGGPAAPADANAAPGPGDVLSPMVGTVYISPAPGSEPFVRMGDAVARGQTVLIVEAMKTMNPILAPESGTVDRILIADGEAVEYGQLLMVVL